MIRKILFPLIVAILMPALAVAADNNQPVINFVNKFNAKIEKINTENHDTKAKKQKIKDIFNAAADFKQMTKFVLGRHIRGLSDSQKQKFAQVYHDYLLAYYGNIFIHSSYDSMKIHNITWPSKNKTRVTVKVVQSGSAAEIIFVINVKEGKYYVFDLESEGISLLAAQRAEFDSVIGAKGVEGLIVSLQKVISAN